MEEIEVKGNYLYINGNVLRFETEEQAEELLMKLLMNGFLDRK